MVSVGPPAAKGTIKLIGLSGYFCACTVPVANKLAPATATNNAFNDFFKFIQESPKGESSGYFAMFLLFKT
jgi:hypothetical protein